MGFSVRAIATKSSFLDVADILDPLLMAVLGKKQFLFGGNNYLSQFNNIL